jgi:hypothetical protein
MGFNDAKRQVLAALKNGTWRVEARQHVDAKNKLATGEVSVDELVKVIGRSRGQDHAMRPHDRDQAVTVHIIRKDGWYIKFYFIEPLTFFISVHEEGQV